MSASHPVSVRRQPVVIPTYPLPPPDRHPMFFEKRVYQGSSGKVYPLPFYDRVGETKVDQTWDAVHIENEYLYVMVLPQLGGRIHIGRDKTNGYDFFYRQNVIKPALVGLAGPWISGGVEFNWPQHHRPSTFLPVDVHIEEHADGSKTVWCSEHEPMNRMKGMHGVCLHPGKAYIELKVRLYNRTPLPQTFLWWANAAVHVHDQYQAFFPPDVQYVADHAKRAMSQFPICRGFYYGVDYRPGTDLRWYKNIPVPTSYMAMGSKQDFFGGYDHAKQAGFVHVANHHISPGKKLWTWGNHEFGHAWDRNLTDADGPYIELMAGVYTDNQPDFSFLMPGETKTFRQFWYPIQKIGPVLHANLDAAIGEHGVCVTREFAGATVRVAGKDNKVDLAPGRPFLCRSGIPAATVTVVTAADGREIIRYEPKPAKKGKVPPPATEPPLPADIAGNDELYLTGLHLEQYRHATRSPEPYWREALRRDPGDSRCHNALGLWHLRRGEFARAEQHFRRAIERLTRRNPNPYDGEPYYNLGLALRYQMAGRARPPGAPHADGPSARPYQQLYDEAYAAFYKATWNYAWQSAGYHALAEMDCCRQDWTTALDHLDRSLRVNADNLRARDLKAIVLRKLGRDAEADALLRETLALDPLDWWARHLLGEKIACDDQTRLDIALDCARAGIPFPFEYQPSDSCFPSRLEEIGLLEARGDARSRYYLGCLFYDKRRYDDAIRQWEKSAKLDPAFPAVWRNLGIAYFNVRKQPGKARAAYEKAFRADPKDGRLLYERDQLWKRLAVSPAKRLAELERHLDLVRQRDDLSIELCTLYNLTGQPEKALAILTGRKFQPWEGGEGQALGQWVRTQLALGNYEAALSPPANLGEARHLLANASEVWYRLGCATGDRRWWSKAAEFRGDFQQMSVRQFSEMTYYAARSLEKLGRKAAARQLLRELLAYARKLYRAEAKMDYFATSLPTMLLFEDDWQKRQQTTALFLMAQAQWGLGRKREARKLLAQVLRADPAHALAADLWNETGGSK